MKNLLALAHATLNTLHHANNLPDTAIQKSRSCFAAAFC